MWGHMFLCLSPTMGFFNENDSLAYSAILERIVVRSVFTVGFFKTLSFLSLLVGFFRGQGRTYISTPLSLVGLRRPNIRKEIFLAFCTKFERHTLQRPLSRNLGQGSC